MTLPLAGCAGAVDTQGLFVQPGKFRFLPCKDLNLRMATAAKRERELNSLVERANEGPGGSVISRLIYGPELAQARADQREIQQTINEKNCNVTPGPAGPALR